MKNFIATVAVVLTAFTTSANADVVTTANGHSFEAPHSITHETADLAYSSGFRMFHNGIDRLLSEEETAFVLNHLMHDLESAGRLWGVLGELGATEAQQKVENFADFLIRRIEENTVVDDQEFTFRTKVRSHLKTAFALGRGRGTSDYRIGEVNIRKSVIKHKFLSGAFTMDEINSKVIAGSVYVKWIGE